MLLSSFQENICLWGGELKSLLDSGVLLSLIVDESGSVKIGSGIRMLFLWCLPTSNFIFLLSNILLILAYPIILSVAAPSGLTYGTLLIRNCLLGLNKFSFGAPKFKMVWSYGCYY
jgi:hypothetical protein